MLAIFVSFAVLGCLFIPVGIVRLLRRRENSKKRSPLSRNLLRSPGESLRKKCDDLIWNIAVDLTLLPLLPLLLYATHLTQSYLLNQAETGFRIGLTVGLSLIIFLFLAFKLVKKLMRVWKLRLGYEAEQAMGQELDQLMRHGAVVFHDLPADGFNIDHIAVTPKGVYAVETKGRSKPNMNRGTEDATVVYDGKTFHFPGWSESSPLEQARSQAIWLARWLTSAVGETVAVTPVLALPGWFVDRKGRSDVLVISGREAPALLKAGRDVLSPSLVRRIEHQLDQRCRDVEPSMAKKESFT